MAVRLSARDIRSSVGSNLALIREETNLNPWLINKTTLRSALTSLETVIPEDRDVWRVPYLASLLDQRMFYQYSANSTMETKISELIDSLVIS